MFRTLTAALLTLVLTAAPSLADQAFTLGIRSVDTLGQGDDDAELFWRSTTERRLIGPSRLAYGASVTSAGAVWVGLGAVMPLIDRNGFYLGTSLMPGLYARGSGPDLGHAVQFRSGIELGYTWESGARLSLVADHLSNAGLDDINPGSNMIGLRFTMPTR